MALVFFLSLIAFAQLDKIECKTMHNRRHEKRNSFHSCLPQSMQSVIYMSDAGERQIETMRWGFKLPDRVLHRSPVVTANWRCVQEPVTSYASVPLSRRIRCTSWTPCSTTRGVCRSRSVALAKAAPIKTISRLRMHV